MYILAMMNIETTKSFTFMVYYCEEVRSTHIQVSTVQVMYLTIGRRREGGREGGRKVTCTACLSFNHKKKRCGKITIFITKWYENQVDLSRYEYGDFA